MHKIFDNNTIIYQACTYYKNNIKNKNNNNKWKFIEVSLCIFQIVNLQSSAISLKLKLVYFKSITMEIKKRAFPNEIPHDRTTQNILFFKKYKHLNHLLSSRS